MSEGFFIIIDVITVAVGIYLLIFPVKAYETFRTKDPRNQTKMPARWPITGRIIGALFIIFPVIIYFASH